MSIYKADQNKANPQTTEVKVPNYGDIKIEEAKGALEQVKRTTTLLITQIKTETAETENRRRIEEEKRKKERANQIQNEVITSHKKNVEIDWNWQELEEKEDCKELASDIEKQIIECKKIIEDKEALKKQFEDALHAKDKHYVKAMQDMNNHIDDLIAQMKKQFLHMREFYSTQLTEIESEFDRERQDLLKQNEVEIQKLFAKHQATEEDFLIKKQKLEQDQNQELENQKSQDANNQAEQKIKLEKEMQILEKCMEDMKAVYRLNEEKLDFNKTVLDQRKSVNENQMKSLKKKEQTYKDIVATVRKAYVEELQVYTNDNRKLTNKFRETTKMYKDLQKKFQMFEKSDNQRLQEIWQMNEIEAKAIVSKIIEADKVIHTQQLDVPWVPPQDEYFQKMLQSQDQNSPESFQGAESQAQHSQIDAQNTQSKSDLPQDMSQHTSDNKDQGADNALRYEKIKNVFKLLIEDAEYLIDDRAFERCEGESLKKQFSIKIDSIRKSLGIEEMRDVDLLVKVFYEFEASYQKELQEELDKKIAECDAQAQEQGINIQQNQDIRRQSQEEIDEAKAEAERNPARLNLDPDNIVEALKVYHKERDEFLTNLAAMGGQVTKKKAALADAEELAEREKKKQQMIWKKMTEVLDPQKLSVWRSLDRTLANYYEMLVKRQNLIEETGLLNQQNEELKTLLNQYLQAGVNQELQVPPTQVIRLDI